MRARELRERIAAIANHDAAAGITMLFFTLLALAWQNSPYSVNYRAWLELKAGVVFGSFELIKPVLLWVNDGLITIFFFSIGLELKHEFLEGQLSEKKKLILPSAAALGGMLTPALFFYAFNYFDPYALRGWAIPTATDTAFAVGILMLLGKRVPSSLKIFLLSLAIFDDVGAIAVIAIFYTSKLSAAALFGALIAIVALLVLNLMQVSRRSLYLIAGLFLWFCILKSGVHATLAGIITAFFIPLRDEHGYPIVHHLYENLKSWLALFILPVFVFVNAGVDLSNISLDSLFNHVSLGIFFGLFLGKQLGVFAFTMLCIKLKLAKMPEGASIKQLYGVCILTGIGFTMSFFVDGLAYWGSDIFNYADALAILLASLCSGVLGWVFLRFFASRPAKPAKIKAKPVRIWKAAKTRQTAAAARAEHITADDIKAAVKAVKDEAEGKAAAADSADASHDQAASDDAAADKTQGKNLKLSAEA